MPRLSSSNGKAGTPAIASGANRLITQISDHMGALVIIAVDGMVHRELGVFRVAYGADAHYM